MDGKIDWNDMLERRSIAAAVDALSNGNEYRDGKVVVEWSKQEPLLPGSRTLDLFLNADLVVSRVWAGHGFTYHYAVYWNPSNAERISVIMSLLNNRGITFTVPGTPNEQD